MATYGRKTIYLLISSQNIPCCIQLNVGSGCCAKLVTANLLTHHGPAQALTGKQQLSGAEAGGWLQAHPSSPLLWDGWQDLLTATQPLMALGLSSNQQL